jgi:hypothetical protein
LSERSDIGSDRERGEASREGWGSDQSGHPVKHTRTRPELSDPAEEVVNPPTHPSHDSGLGQVEETEGADEAPVPRGDPMSEKDRTDLQ